MNQLLYILFLYVCIINPSETKLCITEDEEINSNRILIVYLTRTRNTEAVAQMIKNEIGGDMVALELINPYPENYDAIVKQVAEENVSGFLPELKTKINITDYDTVFLGFPTWGMQLPPPIKSFLSNYDLSGKTVIPFNTNAGYGLGQIIEQLNDLCQNCNILDEFSVKGGIERDGVLFVMVGEKERLVKKEVREWLKEINILK